MSSAPLLVSFLGALQASVSVLLTLAYGLIAARFALIKESSARDVSKLCVNMFLPMLIMTNVGKEIDADNIKKYLPIMLWSISYTLISIGYGSIFVRFFGFPAWTSPACSFNNTTSLPLLLVQSLAVTGLMENIANGDVDEAVERSKSYFLINSMISNGLTFALGPKLLAEGDDSEEDEVDDSGNNHNRNKYARSRSYCSDHSNPDAQLDEESGGAEDADGEADETTYLVPSRVRKPVSSVYGKISARLHHWFSQLPEPVQKPLVFMGSMVNAPLIGAALALFVGLIPPIHKAMFNSFEHGGWMKAWFTTSLKNVGELFTALQMFVVGTKLNTSIEEQKKKGDNDGATRVPKRSLAVIYLLRFILWPVASIAMIYFLAKKKMLTDDPVLWFSMMLMPCGPPAIILASLAELKGDANTKLQIAKMLMVSYAISPIICFTVVGALKASEAAAGN